ncbi:hypothetical protein PG996_007716 [Apiospora saccharicola]|uniref:Uncharacterized protein n=1 Tax=Apiospora saccharicola TaxID=335842 RepID=A0ABR1VBN5_9PEZI
MKEEKRRALESRRVSGELTQEQYRRKKLVGGITPPPKTHQPILTMPLPSSGSIMVQNDRPGCYITQGQYLEVSPELSYVKEIDIPRKLLENITNKDKRAPY